MNYRLILFEMCVIAVFVGVFEVFSAGIGYCSGDEWKDFFPLLICGSATLIAGVAGGIFLRPRTEQQKKAGLREGYAGAAFGWLVASALGALPFHFGANMHWYDALFESASGFTTTGVALIHRGYAMTNGGVLENGVESLSKGIVFWRSLESWLGGIGIVVLMVAILPRFNRGIQKLYNAETPGLKSSDTQIAPSTRKSAILLFKLYIGITFVEAFLLWCTGKMDFFEATCNSFTTVSTGGFCTRQDSIAAFDSTPVTLIVTFFMFISGVNFFLHARLFSGKPLSYLKDEEFRVYSFILIIVSGIVALSLLWCGPGDYFFFGSGSFLQSAECIGVAFRDAAFQVTSIMTSSGFAINDYCTWPSVAVALIVGISVIGGCGGSTAGGLKCVRALLVWKQSQTEVKHNIFPQLVTGVYLNDVRVKAPAIQKTVAFFIAYIGVILLFALLIPFLCYDCSWETGLSASITCLSNVGPGVGPIGPSGDFDWLNPAAKLLLSLEMIIGRLELFTFLVLFQRSFWRK